MINKLDLSENLVSIEILHFWKIPFWSDISKISFRSKLLNFLEFLVSINSFDFLEYLVSSKNLDFLGYFLYLIRVFAQNKLNLREVKNEIISFLALISLPDLTRKWPQQPKVVVLTSVLISNLMKIELG